MLAQTRLWAACSPPAGLGLGGRLLSLASSSDSSVLPAGRTQPVSLGGRERSTRLSPLLGLARIACLRPSR
jgi:hypothetical protein